MHPFPFFSAEKNCRISSVSRQNDSPIIGTSTSTPPPRNMPSSGGSGGDGEISRSPWIKLTPASRNIAKLPPKLFNSDFPPELHFPPPHPRRRVHLPVVS